MALTGFTRTGHCVEKKDDEGSHHICIDLSSESLGGKVSFSLFCAFRLQTIDLIPSLTRTTQNFCEVTGQDDWCDSKMKCNDGSKEKCPGKPGSDISGVELSIISRTPVNNIFSRALVCVPVGFRGLSGQSRRVRFHSRNRLRRNKYGGHLGLPGRRRKARGGTRVSQEAVQTRRGY